MSDLVCPDGSETSEFPDSLLPVKYLREAGMAGNFRGRKRVEIG
jgi:hypothetical protein